MSCTPEKHISARTKYCPDCGQLIRAVRIERQEDLRQVAEQLGVRPDWHEPDEQKVTAKFDGFYFDNAGFWPDAEQSTTLRDAKATEMCILLYKEDRLVAMVNLATLFALACGTIE